MPVVNKLNLIRSVGARPILWNHRHPNYHNRELAKLEWDRVTKEVGCSTLECRRTWRNLRDTFMKEMRKSATSEDGKKSTWRYIDELSFLTNQIKNPTGNSSTSSDTIWSNEEPGDYPTSMEDMDDETDSKAHLQALLSAGTSNETTDIRYQFEPEVNLRKSSEMGVITSSSSPATVDSDYYFLMSLLPSLRSIPERRKNILRSKILQIICEEEQQIL